MKKIKNISILLLLLIVSSNAFAQVTIGRQVIGTTGGFHQVSAGNSYSYTVGETVVQTVGIFSVSTILTQGFQQVSLDSAVTYEVINESCLGAKNGSIFINDVLGCAGPYSLQISDTNNTTIILDEKTLAAGVYNVVITGANGCVKTSIIYVGLDSEENCILKFFTGFTPNGDGINDVWVIENIEQFPDNEIKIFNRWGNQVFFETGYDNVDRAWDGNGDSGLLPDATYFYLAVVGKNTYKGWIELTR